MDIMDTHYSPMEIRTINLNLPIVQLHQR